MNNTFNGKTAQNGAALSPVKISINLKINGQDRQIKVAPWVTLLDYLRGRLNLTSTKTIDLSKKGFIEHHAYLKFRDRDELRISLVAVAVGKENFQAAAETIFKEAKGFEHNAFKIEPGKSAVVRSLGKSSR